MGIKHIEAEPGDTIVIEAIGKKEPGGRKPFIENGLSNEQKGLLRDFRGLVDMSIEVVIAAAGKDPDAIDEARRILENGVGDRSLQVFALECKRFGLVRLVRQDEGREVEVTLDDVFVDVAADQIGGNPRYPTSRSARADAALLCDMIVREMSASF